ncbi:4'-phosphopantetheinyl transferase superfamily protein [Marinobacter sp. SS5-14b]|uniref:4'-phosphopantetheinyl transferase family protein n=1 Tax=Marinobacter sp. SS5-14b TaxID=3050456 RepID=UPI0026DEACC0|nr:4'-phosphopantetheinyl transferase superfamily protein [Marinobacter sp. SS5-14b]
MAGLSNDYNPERPCIWLCHQIQKDTAESPAWLTPAETETLAKLEGSRHREYLCSRWLIRQSLSRVSGLPPERCEPVDGRPVASRTPEGWHMSLSHSRVLAAVATGRRPVGIDIEPSQRKPDWIGVARRWFSPVEQEWLLRADDPFNFLKVWTLKEAWLKATGRGIAGNLQTLEVRKDFELYGDQPDRAWLASCFYIEGYLATLVYQADDTTTSGAWPSITLLEPPPEDFRLTTTAPIQVSWEPMFHRVIRAKR